MGENIAFFLTIGFFLLIFLCIRWVEKNTNVTDMKSAEELGLKLRKKWISLFSKPKEKFPKEIIIEQVTPSDDEVLDEWVRRLDKNHLQFHSVDAIRVDDDNFPWYLYFGAGEFIREEPYVTYLNDAIYKAILNTEGVKNAFHEDTEKYVITGAPSGEELLQNVSKAIDLFIIEYIEKWEESIKT